VNAACQPYVDFQCVFCDARLAGGQLHADECRQLGATTGGLGVARFWVHPLLEKHVIGAMCAAASSCPGSSGTRPSWDMPAQGL
jgi:hypothetical protein